ncbi:MAG TPA: alginate export family protein [Candidatus Acidoferrales bacterium]|nr:alginate export family protein [Candidatus Acidoferrales bacterium]
MPKVLISVQKCMHGCAEKWWGAFGARLLAAFLFALLFVWPSFGQDSSSLVANASVSGDAAAPKPKPREVAPQKHLQVGPIVISGSLRGRGEDWGWFETPGFNDAYTFGALTLRLAVSQQTEHVDWLVEGEFPSLINLPQHAIAPAPQGQLGLGASYFGANHQQDASAVPKQAYARFKFSIAGQPTSLRVGRMEFSDGSETTPSNAILATLKRERLSQRLIGPFGFSHVGRSFDGLELVSGSSTSNFTFFAARPTEGVFQLRSTNELDVDLYYGAWTREVKLRKAVSETRLFGLYYHDGRRVTKVDNRPAADIAADHDKLRIATLGGDWISAIPAGRGNIDLLFWGAGQFGDWGNLAQRAGAISAEGGYQFSSKWQPWIRGGYFWSSGDGNPNDGTHSTFFQILPTPRIYARFPFFNLMNLQDTSLEFRLKPLKRLSVRSDVRYLRLSNSKDLWYSGGGAFQKNTFGYSGRPSGGHSGLGTLFDASADVKVTRSTNVTLYFAGVRGSGVESSIYPQGGANPIAHLYYLEFQQSF